jgi:hypothetical protein
MQGIVIPSGARDLLFVGFEDHKRYLMTKWITEKP